MREQTTLLHQNYSNENYDSIFDKLSSLRFKIAFLGFLGFALMNSIRVTMCIAIVDMVADQVSEFESYNENCPAPNDIELANQNKGAFDWSTTKQSVILAAPFYGFVSTQMLGYHLASKYGGKRTFGYNVLVKSILVILNPPFAYIGVHWLVLLRVIEGMLEGLTLPAYCHLAARWAPELERTLFYGLSFSGCSLGILFGYTVSGYLSTLDFLNGWPLGFLLNGILGINWFVFWNYFAADCPDNHPRISEKEQIYVNKLTKVDDSTKHPIPWKEMFTSLPFYGFLIAVMSISCVDYALLTGLPLYFSNVLNFDVQTNGYLCSLLWLCNLLGAILASFYTDFFRAKHLVSTTFIRKLNQTISAIIPAALFISAGYAECWALLAISLISTGAFFSGFYNAGGYCNNLDIAPYFAGSVAAIATMIGSLPATFMPIAVGLITSDNIHSKELWLYCFYLIGAISTFGGLLFLILGSGEVQSWGNPASEQQKEKCEDKI